MKNTNHTILRSELFEQNNIPFEKWCIQKKNETTISTNKNNNKQYKTTKAIEPDNNHIGKKNNL